MRDPRIIVIGDVHGVYEELKELLALVEYRPGNDRLVFVGDQDLLVGFGHDGRALWLSPTEASERDIVVYETDDLRVAARALDRAGVDVYRVERYQ